jgi:uncharacterized protein
VSPVALDRLGRTERARQRLDFFLEPTTELRAAGLIEPRRLHGIERDRAGPLRVIGDGSTPRYHDAEAGQVTLHGRGSLHALTAALAHVEGSERRFRSNIALEGLGAWEEQRWVGRKVRIGTVTFDVVRPKVRCLATHANPTTGERDVPMLTTLTKVFGQEKPTFAVAMVPSHAGGHIHVGDHVTLVE